MEGRGTPTSNILGPKEANGETDNTHGLLKYCSLYITQETNKRQQLYVAIGPGTSGRDQRSTLGSEEENSSGVN